MADLTDTDLKFFVDAVRKYFHVTTRLEPDIASAYLATGDIDAFDYSGVVTFSGSYNGHIMVSAPERMLKELLLLQYQNDLSSANLLDAVGELTNTLAGNARQAFGSELHISVPIAFTGKSGVQARVRKRPFVVSLTWAHHRALVCVDMQKSAA
jgi:chemotaxis protein CheX